MTTKQLDWVAIVVILLIAANLAQPDALAEDAHGRLVTVLVLVAIAVRLIATAYAVRAVGTRTRVIEWLRTVDDDGWEETVTPSQASLLFLLGAVAPDLHRDRFGHAVTFHRRVRPEASG